MPRYQIGCRFVPKLRAIFIAKNYTYLDLINREPAGRSRTFDLNEIPQKEPQKLPVLIQGRHERVRNAILRLYVLIEIFRIDDAFPVTLKPRAA